MAAFSHCKGLAYEHQDRWPARELAYEQQKRWSSGARSHNLAPLSQVRQSVRDNIGSFCMRRQIFRMAAIWTSAL
eukprot:3594427-Amphidinium_carterae.1